MRSFLSLVGLLIGAYIYVLWDDSFHPRGYAWIAIWYFVFTIDQVYIKHVCNTVKMKSNWGRVYYSNLIPSIPLFFMSIGQGESPEWTQFGIGILALSCLLGISMSYFAFLARHRLSATYFTIIGNVCKILTVILNQFCAYLYRQAPMRKERTMGRLELKN